jgi:hypothetical protein
VPASGANAKPACSTEPRKPFPVSTVIWCPPGREAAGDLQQRDEFAGYRRRGNDDFRHVFDFFRSGRLICIRNIKHRTVISAGTDCRGQTLAGCLPGSLIDRCPIGHKAFHEQTSPMFPLHALSLLIIPLHAHARADRPWP